MNMDANAKDPNKKSSFATNTASSNVILSQYNMKVIPEEGGEYYNNTP